MRDWNAIATVHEHGFAEARRILLALGRVERTPYYNVLAMKVEDPERLLIEFGRQVEEAPGILNSVAHLFPAQRCVAFHDAADFEAKLRGLCSDWLAALAGTTFHVRLKRRGLKRILSTPAQERALDEFLLQALAAAGTPGRVGFQEPDAVIRIETIDHRAGASLWAREQYRRYRFLSAD